MKNIKPKGWGAYTPERVRQVIMSGAMCQHEDGLWYPAVPLPYTSIMERIRYAWDVLTYKAEPLYWYFEKGWDRTVPIPDKKPNIKQGL